MDMGSLRVWVFSVLALISTEDGFRRLWGITFKSGVVKVGCPVSVLGALKGLPGLFDGGSIVWRRSQAQCYGEAFGFGWLRFRFGV